MFARFDENPAMTLRVIKETKRFGRTDARTNARTDGQRENTIPPTNKVCGGYNNDNDPSNSNRYLYLSAKCLRRQIKDKARQQRESAKTSKIIDDDIEGSDRNISSIDISSECALDIIPLDLFNYLGWLLTDEDLTFQTDGKLNVSDSLHRTIISLA